MAFFGLCKLWDLENFRGLRSLFPHQGSTLCLLRDSKRLPPDPQLQGGHCTLCLQHNIHTSCNLQTTDSGENIPILMRKLRGKWVEIIKNSGKMMLKILYEPCVKSNFIFICFNYMVERKETQFLPFSWKIRPSGEKSPLPPIA